MRDNTSIEEEKVSMLIVITLLEKLLRSYKVIKKGKKQCDGFMGSG